VSVVYLPCSTHLHEGIDVYERSQTIARLARLMKRNDGWVSLFPPGSGVAESYARFNEEMSRLPRRERRRARDGLLLELAGSFVDKAILNGLSYEAMNEDLAKIEQGLSG
jgi:hypothetical protein